VRLTPEYPANEQCFACVKPEDCVGISCDIVGGCGDGIPAGYYPDLTNCNSYCKCTGTVASSRYETCNAGLEWDTHQQGTNQYLPGNFGNDGLGGTNGGGCGWDWQMTSTGKHRPGCDLPAVTDFSVAPDGSVCGEATPEPTASPTAAPTSSPTVAPTASPTSSPTASPTATPTAAPTAAPTTTEAPPTTTEGRRRTSITGDPHATNMDGQRFNVVRVGAHEFLRVPRGPPGDGLSAEPLLRVVGRVEALRHGCGFPFVREVFVEGQLLGSVGRLRFGTGGSSPEGHGAALLSINGSEVGQEAFAQRARGVAVVVVPQKHASRRHDTIHRQTFLTVQLRLGPANISIDWVHRSVPADALIDEVDEVNHINFDVSNLRLLSEQFDMDIGGILGRDDHTLAATVGPQCAPYASLDLRSSRESSPLSYATASF